jgi:hypothetical protein
LLGHDQGRHGLKEENKCIVCGSFLNQTPGKRTRKTCNGKCRKIKYLNATESNRRRDSLIHSRIRLQAKLGFIEKELELLGWRKEE